MSLYQPLIWGYRCFLMAAAPDGYAWAPIKRVPVGDYVAHGLFFVAKRLDSGVVLGDPVLESSEQAARDRAYYCLRHANAEPWGAREIS